MILIALLVLVASAQVCPYCQWNACTVTTQGLGNCSACSNGALIQVQVGSQFGTTWEQSIGICQQCPVGCLTCQYTEYTPPMTAMVVTLQCTSCSQGYTFNSTTGYCGSCGPNCLACSCGGQFCDYTYCSTCASGYQLGPLTTYFACVATTVALQQNESSNQSSNLGVTIGLSVWGSVMTIAAVIFLILWITKKEAKATPGALLNSEIEVSQIRA